MTASNRMGHGQPLGRNKKLSFYVTGSQVGKRGTPGTEWFM